MIPVLLCWLGFNAISLAKTVERYGLPVACSARTLMDSLIDPASQRAAQLVAMTRPGYYSHQALIDLYLNPSCNPSLCGNATVIVDVADLAPVIYARPTLAYRTNPVNVVVDLIELNGIATSGPITVKVTKNARFSVSFLPTAVAVGGRPVQNSQWTFDEKTDSNYYVLTTTQVIAGGSLLSFGLSGTLTAGATSGTFSLSSVIGSGSGGEISVINNLDADKIDYFQQ